MVRVFSPVCRRTVRETWSGPRPKVGREDSMSTKEMNGVDSPCGSDGSGWGFGSPAAVDWTVCTPCAKPFHPGLSQLSSSEFSSQQLPGSVRSGGSGWGVVFQQTPVGAGDMDLARTRSPRSFFDSSPFERDVEANLLLTPTLPSASACNNSHPKVSRSRLQRLASRGRRASSHLHEDADKVHWPLA